MSVSLLTAAASESDIEAFEVIRMKIAFPVDDYLLFLLLIELCEECIGYLILYCACR
jgi:hypothetical protein